jgi:hypothetical protein
MTIHKSYFAWIAATSLGLCVGFPAALQVLRLIKYRQLSWVGDWVGEDFVVHGNVYLAQFVALLVMGTILGASQSVVTRLHGVPVVPWIVATAVGFFSVSVVIIPMLYAGIWGNIPGPIEPLIITVGGCSLAGIFQYILLRRNQIRAGKWLGIWLGSLILSIVPTAVVFMTLEGLLGIDINWPAQVALTGLLIGGFAALFSGQIFLKTLPGR